jgi:hypothetical protein
MPKQRRSPQQRRRAHNRATMRANFQARQALRVHSLINGPAHMGTASRARLATANAYHDEYK